MTKVDIQKVTSPEDRSLPIFSELDDLMDRIRVRAFNLFRDRGSSVGRDLDDWFTAEREICWPSVELEEEDDEFEVKVALAGFSASEVTVTASPRELIVKAKHESKRDETEKPNVRFSEFRSNNAYRRVELPSDINVDKIKANFKNGLLEIDAPKAARKEKRTKVIEVTAKD